MTFAQWFARFWRRMAEPEPPLWGQPQPQPQPRSISPQAPVPALATKSLTLVMADAQDRIFTVRDGVETALPQLGRHPSWTPNGDIIFVTAGRGPSRIACMDERGKLLWSFPVSGVTELATPRMTQRGLIVFGAVAEPRNPMTKPGIWTTIEGSDVRQIVANGVQPSVSPDGTWISYTVELGDPQPFKPVHRAIFRCAVDGSGYSRQLTFPSEYPDEPDCNASSISIDGTEIFIFSGVESSGLPGTVSPGRRNIAVIPADGGARKLLTNYPAGGGIIGDDPCALPDGRVAYHFGTSGGGSTWVLDRKARSESLLYPKTTDGGGQLAK